MREKMARPDHSALYRLRKQKVEPVFGIVKQAMGFRQFLLRGIRQGPGRVEPGDAGLQLQASTQLGKTMTGTSGGVHARIEGRTPHYTARQRRERQHGTLPLRGDGWRIWAINTEDR